MRRRGEAPESADYRFSSCRLSAPLCIHLGSLKPIPRRCGSVSCSCACRFFDRLHDERLPGWKADDLFRAILEVAVESPCCARAASEAIVVTENDAARRQTIEEEGKRVERRLVEID